MAIVDPSGLTPVDSLYYLPALVYDEFDLSAMALRGLNAERGRLAGDANPPGAYPKPLADPNEYRQDLPFGERLKLEHPLRPRYFLEYPHAALLLFRAGFAIQPGARDLAVPPAFADCDYHDIAVFEPTLAEHRELMRTVAAATHFYVGAMIVCWLALVLVLTLGYGRETGLYGGAALLLLPAMLYFTLNRYDVLPALLMALCFACLGRRWRAGSAFFLGLAVLVKVYPILLAPLIIRYLWPERRAAIRWSLILAATGLLAFTPLLFGADLQAIVAPYRYQFTREAESGMTIYGCLLPPRAAEAPFGPVFRLATLILALGVSVYYPIRDLAAVLRRGALVLLVFVTFAAFYSPQWLLWFAPLLFPLVRRDPRLGWTIAALDVVTYLTFPVWFWVLAQVCRHELSGTMVHYDIGVMLRFLRFGLCAVIGWQLIRAEWPLILRGTWLARKLPDVAQFMVQKI